MYMAYFCTSHPCVYKGSFSGKGHGYGRTDSWDLNQKLAVEPILRILTKRLPSLGIEPRTFSLLLLLIMRLTLCQLSYKGTGLLRYEIT